MYYSTYTALFVHTIFLSKTIKIQQLIHSIHHMTLEGRFLVIVVASACLNQCLYCHPRNHKGREVEMSSKAQEQKAHLTNNIQTLQMAKH